MDRKTALEQGLKVYDGPPCKRGHHEGRYAKSNGCVTCARLKAEEQRARLGSEGQRAAHKSWRDRNRAALRERQQNYRSQNIEAAQRSSREWAERNKDKVRVNTKRWRLANPDRAKARLKRWREAHPGKVRNYVAWRRAYKARATPRCPEIRKQIKQIYVNCPEGLVVDHIIPLKHPLVCGWHHPNNLQYLTAAENGSKGNSFEIG